METTIILKSLASLGIVFAILYIALKIIQKYTKFGQVSSFDNKKDICLKIENIVYIDDTMKLVSITNQIGNNYVIAVGKNNSFLVDKYDIHQEKQRE